MITYVAGGMRLKEVRLIIGRQIECIGRGNK